MRRLAASDGGTEGGGGEGGGGEGGGEGGGGEDVIYGRVSDTKGNYETLTISKPELKEFMFGPDVIEIMM